MEADQEQLRWLPGSEDPWLEEVLRDVVVERFFRRTHRYWNNRACRPTKGFSRKIARRAEACAEYDLQAILQLQVLALRHLAFVGPQNTSRKVGRSPSSVPSGSTNCTSPQSSTRLFWIGVAVSSMTGVPWCWRTSRTRPRSARPSRSRRNGPGRRTACGFREHLVRLVDYAQIELVGEH